MTIFLCKSPLLSNWVSNGGNIVLVGDPYGRAIKFANYFFDTKWEYSDMRDTIITSTASRYTNNTTNTPFEDIYYKTLNLLYNTYPVSYSPSEDKIFDLSVVSTAYENGRITYISWDFSSLNDVSSTDQAHYADLVAKSILLFQDVSDVQFSKFTIATIKPKLKTVLSNFLCLYLEKKIPHKLLTIRNHFI